MLRFRREQHTLADHYFSSNLDYLQTKGIDSNTALRASGFTEFSLQLSQILARRRCFQSFNGIVVNG
ncbi:hypothetical protein CWB83_20730, partial [Pseudoalteromonas sp. S1691]